MSYIPNLTAPDDAYANPVVALDPCGLGSGMKSSISADLMADPAAYPPIFQEGIELELLHSQPRPVLLNMTVEEIERLASPQDRAMALTMSLLDLTDDRVRALIQSVKRQAAGPMGAALQDRLAPAVKPTPRPRRKSAQKAVPKAVLRETRGNLFELLTEVAAPGTALTTYEESAGATPELLTMTETSSVVPDPSVVPPPTEVTETGTDAEASPPSEGPETTLMTSISGVSWMDLGKRVLAHSAVPATASTPSL